MSISPFFTIGSSSIGCGFIEKPYLFFLFKDPLSSTSAASFTMVNQCSSITPMLGTYRPRFESFEDFHSYFCSVFTEDYIAFEKEERFDPLLLL